MDCGYNKFIWGIGLEAGIIDVMNKKESRDLHYRNENISVSAGYRF